MAEPAKKKPSPKVEIDKERCKQCELCITFCNRNCLKVGEEMNSSGYFYVVFYDPESCTGCGLCAEMCPDLAIQVWK